MENQELSTRLDKIEIALVTLARVEERQLSQAESLGTMLTSQNKFYERLRSVELTLTENRAKISMGTWIIATTGGAAMALLGYFLRVKG